jgi:hypothetical protein
VKNGTPTNDGQARLSSATEKLSPLLFALSASMALAMKKVAAGCFSISASTTFLAVSSNLMVDAVRNADLPIIQAVGLTYAAIVLVINTVVDALYLVLNPKLRAAA